MTTPSPRLRLLAGLLALAALPACGGGSRPAQDPGTAAPVALFDEDLRARLPEHVRTRGELRVATDAAYPPANTFAADGRTIVGFEPDLAAALGRVLGVRFAFVRTDFADTLPALEQSRVDVVMSAMTDTAERRAAVDFVDYFSAGTSIVVQRGNPYGVSDLGDLCGQTVAVEQATVHVDLLQRTQRSCADDDRIVVRALADNASALVELRTGRAAAVLSDYPPAAALTTAPRTSADFQLASTAQYEPGFYGIAVPKDQPGLRDALQEALARVVRSGEYERVLSDWGVSSGGLDRVTVNGGA